MDEIFVLICLGFVLVGVIIGYPLGHIFGQRDAFCREDRRADSDVLSAEVIE